MPYHGIKLCNRYLDQHYISSIEVNTMHIDNFWKPFKDIRSAPSRYWFDLVCRIKIYNNLLGSIQRKVTSKFLYTVYVIGLCYKCDWLTPRMFIIVCNRPRHWITTGICVVTYTSKAIYLMFRNETYSRLDYDINFIDVVVWQVIYDLTSMITRDAWGAGNIDVLKSLFL